MSSDNHVSPPAGDAGGDTTVHGLRLGVHHAFIYWVLGACVSMLVGFILQPKELTEPVSEYSYALFNRLFGHWENEAENVDDIGVILLNQESLADLNASWPPVFSIHANVLKSLLAERPLAVFLDFTLRDRRSKIVGVEDANQDGTYGPELDLQFFMRDESLPRLESVLAKYKELGIPVYVASGLQERLGFIDILPELKPYVTLVSGWGDARTQADIRAINYKLIPQPPKSGAVVGAWNKEAAQNATLSPALQIYGDLCRKKFDKKNPLPLEVGANWKCDLDLFDHEHTPDEKIPSQLIDQAFDRPMTLFWLDRQPSYSGWQVAKDGTTADRLFNCYKFKEKDFSFPLSIIWSIYGLIFDVPTANHCGPFDTIQASHVVYASPERSDPWRSHFQNRVVFYGFDLQGFQDVIHPPTVETDIAGVFKHATALQNLLFYGTDYLSDTAYFDWFKISSWWVEFSTLMTVFAIRFLFLLGIKSQNDINLEKRIKGLKSRKLRTTNLRDIQKYLRQQLDTLYQKTGLLLTADRTEENTTKYETSYLGLKIIGVLLIEFLVIALILVLVTFGLELRVLHIAPSNWLTIIGFLTVSYPSYVRYVAAEDLKDRDQKTDKTS